MRKGKVVVFALAYVVCLVVSVIDSAAKTHQFELGLGVSGIVYKEPGIMQEKGIMMGAHGLYCYHVDNVVFQAEGEFKYGQMEYDGSRMDGRALVISGINNYILEGRVLMGYNTSVASPAVAMPFIGIGYRYLIDDLSNSYTYGYRRESRYLYIPVGVKILTELRNEWFIEMIAEYDFFCKGLQTSQMSDLDSRYNDLENDQHSGYGLGGSIKLRKGSFAIEPFVRYWNVEKSDIAILTSNGYSTGRRFFEPENNSTEIGIKISWIF